MRRSHMYEAILLNSDCLPISVNKFNSISKLCSWLEEVDLDLVDCDIFLLFYWRFGMLKYCLKVFDKNNDLCMQLIVPKEELMNYIEDLKQYGIVKGFVIDEQDNERTF